MSQIDKKKESIKKAGALMLQGWAMLGDHCPICYTALLANKERTEMICTMCNLPVKREVPSASASSSSEADSASGSSIAATKSSATTDHVQQQHHEDNGEENEMNDENCDDIIVPTSLEEMKLEWDRKNKERDAVSAKLAEMMLNGWTLLASQCPYSAVNHPTLEGVILVGKGDVTKCVACEAKIGQPVGAAPDGAATATATATATAGTASKPPPAAVATPAPVIATKAVTVASSAAVATETGNKTTIANSAGTTPPPVPIATSAAAASPEDITDRASSLIGSYLLKGYTLLDETCKAYNDDGMPTMCHNRVPLVQRSGISLKICVMCEDTKRKATTAGSASKSILASSSPPAAASTGATAPAASSASVPVKGSSSSSSSATAPASGRSSGNKVTAAGNGTSTGSNNNNSSSSNSSSNNNNRRRRRVAWSASVVEDYEGVAGSWSANAPGGSLTHKGEEEGDYSSSLSSGSENDFYDDDLVVASRRARRNYHGNSSNNSNNGSYNSGGYAGSNNQVGGSASLAGTAGGGGSGGNRFGFVSDVFQQKIFALTKEMEHITVSGTDDATSVGYPTASTAADPAVMVENLRLIREYASTIGDLVGVVNAMKASNK